MIDHSVYPDVEHPPTILLTDAEKADYVARICGAWDFGITPTLATFRLFASWRHVFDTYLITDSPAFMAFRLLYGWPVKPLGGIQRADYEGLDAREGREPDPFARVW